MSLLVLSAGDVSAVSSELSPNVLLSLMALVFVRLHSQQRIAIPQRTSISTKAYNTLFMPARVDDFGTTIKVVSVPLGNHAGGLPATTLVLDEQTGAVKAVVNARSLTALRTAAGSALATRLVGPDVPHVLLVFGAGKQIEAHVDLLIRTFPSLKSCTIVNRSFNSRLESLHASLQSRFTHIRFVMECAIGASGTNLFDLQRAVLSADIICTATSSTQPLFKSSWVKAGAHINLVGSYTPDMVEVEVELIKRAGKIMVDSKEACQLEAGELIRAKVLVEDMVEVGEMTGLDGQGISETIMKMKAAGDVTIFKSVGVGLQDTAIASAVVDKAISMGVGTQIVTYD
ncbi:NAD-binding protein [Phellopilus nigrolimitatus]|nr:NAD-binding protein [Phellopilus nigrolimitatus]